MSDLKIGSYDEVLKAVKDNAFNYENYDLSVFSGEEYFNIMSLIAQVAGYAALEEVDPSKLSVDQYYKLCLIAVEIAGYAIDLIDFDSFSDEQIYNICLKAARFNDEVVNIVKQKKVPLDEIIVLICEASNPNIVEGDEEALDEFESYIAELKEKYDLK